MMTEQTVTLRVSFDAAQISSALVWHAIEGDPARSAYKSQGRFAGALHFDKGDLFEIELIGYGQLGELDGIEIVGANIITMPHTSVHTRSAPSPFQDGHAVVALNDWSAMEMIGQPDPERLGYLSRTKAPLQVVQETGRWELSLVVTVNVLRAGQRSVLRVFAFDPESEVGTGGDPPLIGN